MKKTVSLLLALLLLLPFGPAARAEWGNTVVYPAPWPVSGAEIIDVVAHGRDLEALVALHADGTLTAKGLEKHMDQAVIRELLSLRGVVQIVSTVYELVCVLADGHIWHSGNALDDYSALPAAYDPDRWENVGAVVTNGIECFALTKDGRILVPGYVLRDGYIGGDEIYLSWSGVEKVCGFVYPEARGLFALCADGRILRKNPEYYEFSQPTGSVVDIVTSGYISVCLMADGSVAVTGINAVSNAALLAEIGSIRGAVQAVPDISTLVCLLEDGSVRVCPSSRSYEGISDWRNIRQLAKAGSSLFGLGGDGRVYAASRYAGPEAAVELRRETESWERVVKLRGCSVGETEGYLLAWQEDGTLLAAGIDLSGLEKGGSGKPAGFLDALVLPTDRSWSGLGCVGLKADGSVRAMGLSAETAAALADWRNITQIAQWNGLLLGLRADGSVAVYDCGLSDEPNADLIAELESWRGILALAVTTRHAAGLRADGTLMLCGGDFFGAEQDPDFSDWTGLREIVGGGSSQGEFLAGIRSDGSVVQKGTAADSWYGTPTQVTAVSASGWQMLCLRSDGTAAASGLDASDAVLSWRNLVQVCAGDSLALGLRGDGGVYACANSDEAYARELESWTGIRRLFLGAEGVCFGIRADGSVRLPETRAAYADSPELRGAVGRWTGVDRILYHGHGAVLALKADGSLVSYGVRLA